MQLRVRRLSCVRCRAGIRQEGPRHPITPVLDPSAPPAAAPFPAPETGMYEIHVFTN